VQKGVTGFQRKEQGDHQEKPWAMRRNKVKALRDALREGSAAVESFRTKFTKPELLPDVCPSMINWRREGWQGNYCGYFDAVEMIDWFIPL
jgi:hypothetical protein